MNETRQIVLDTETTGLETSEGHRVIEIGGVEIVNRRLTGEHFHCYLNPERAVDIGAYEVHGLDNAFLADKPRFAERAEALIEFVRDSELVIHNAPFDVGFLDYELELAGRQERLPELCRVCDTLMLARRRHPGQRNSLDALCKRYDVDNTQRTLHGALLDAEILADVYLRMTGGQLGLLLGEEPGTEDSSQTASFTRRARTERLPMTVIRASSEEQAAHESYLNMLQQKAGRCVWREL